MHNIELLAKSLAYIEKNLNRDFRTEDIADACYCSKSTLEKLFRCVNNISVRDYIIRRRMMKAANMLVSQPERSILEVALEYGYSTHESFTRAFKQVWNCKPSEFRQKGRFFELFPRYITPWEKGSEYMETCKNVDISELYDLFTKRKNCYFVCCDIKSLIPINEISHYAGDLAILESMKRMENVAGAEDVVFRIGGDEFALLTASEDIQYAQSIAEQITSKNGTAFSAEGREIPLNLHVGIVKMNGSNIRYNELFTELHHSIEESKN